MMSTDDGREVFIQRIRAMADWMEAHPDLPLSPYSELQVSYFGDMGEARAAREHAPGGWRKQTSPTDNFISYEHGDDDGTAEWQVTYVIHVAKSGSSTCERVQVGTKHIEEHDEPVFEWKCDV
jgi:hypothetical protein